MALEDVDECVVTILRVLSLAALQALRSALQAQIALIRALILKYQAKALAYDVLAAKWTALQAAADAALSSVEQTLTAFPTNLVRYVAQCVQMGDMITSPAQTLSSLRAIANGYGLKVREIVSFSEELGAAQQELEELLQLMLDTLDMIEVIIIEKESPPAA